MISVGIATIPGREDNVQRVVVDLSTQADVIYVWSNSAAAKPEWTADHTNVLWMTGRDLSDGGKFAGYSSTTTGYYLSCDDDLYYPADYVSTLVEGIDRYDGQAICSFHGAILADPPHASYYASSRRNKMHCLADLDRDTQATIVGTGVAGWRTDRFRMTPKMCREACMADIWMAIQAQMQRVPMVVLKHAAGWLLHQPINFSETIYERYVCADHVQTKVLNSWGVPFEVFDL